MLCHSLKAHPRLSKISRPKRLLLLCEEILWSDCQSLIRCPIPVGSIVCCATLCVVVWRIDILMNFDVFTKTEDE